MTEAILEARALTKRFGGLVAVDDVDLLVRRNTVHSLIGPNGAGKTTLFNLLCGLMASDGGTVTFEGRDIGVLPFHKITLEGIGRSFQRTQVFPDLTTFENVRVAAQTRQPRRLSPFRVPRGSDAGSETALRALEIVGLANRATERADILSHGEQRALDVAIALATQPRLLLLDEPTSGLSVGEVATMTDLVNRLRSELGMTVLLVEHNVNLVMNISDVITVLHQGRVLAEGSPEAIRSSRAVAEAYLGTDA